MTRNKWEGREEATKDGRQGNPEIGEKGRKVDERLTFP